MNTDKKLEDASFSDFFQAHEEAAKRRGALAEEGYVVRVEKSPYRGYRVRTAPVDLLLEEDLSISPLGIGGRSKSTWSNER